MSSFNHKMLTILLIVLLAIGNAVYASSDSSKTNDIRVLIDVSGSMKKNDPNDLRRPALRLIAGLLNTGTNAGIWTFGQYVNMLVPHGPVNREWKTAARKASKQIQSHGLFTNLEETLRSSSWDWREADDTQQRSIILLTDGLVDIDKDPSKDKASRTRILKEVLPRLKSAGVTIHTIALSSDADEILMQQLASATNGRYEKIASSQDLEKVFFRMFEKAAKPETLPLINNTVQIDNSIKETTFLIFRKTDSKASQIIMPDDTVFSHDDHPDSVSWHMENNYDLVTVEKPQAGTWKIDADTDPDNRVMVVTDLSLATSSLPNDMAFGDNQTLTVSLNENRKTITRKDFLKFISIDAIQKKDSQKPWRWTLLDNGLRDDNKANDGVYTLSLNRTLEAGQHEIIVRVDGTTFSREQRQRFTVHDKPVITSLQESNHGDYTLYITPIAGLIDNESMQASAIVHYGNTSETHEIHRTEDGEWRLELKNHQSETKNSVLINIKAKRPDGHEINTEIGPLFFGDMHSSDAATHVEDERLEQHNKTPADSEKTTEKHDAQKQTESNEPISDDDSEALNWAFVIPQVLFFNLAIGYGLYFTYKKWHKKIKDEDLPLEEFLNE